LIFTVFGYPSLEFSSSQPHMAKTLCPQKSKTKKLNINPVESTYHDTAPVGKIVAENISNYLELMVMKTPIPPSICNL